MRKTKLSKKKKPTEQEIKEYCLSVEEVLKAINERCSHKKSRKKRIKELINSN